MNTPGPHADGADTIAPDAQRRHPRHHAITAAAVAALALLTIAGGIALRKDRIQRQASADAITAGRTATARAAGAMDVALRAIPTRVTAIRDELERGTLQPGQVAARLTAALGSDEVVSGIGVAFDKDVVPGAPLYAPYLERPATRGEEPLHTDLGTLYDYLDYKYGWYRNTVLDGAGWMETNIFPDTGDQVVMFSSPFVLPAGGQRASGVVFAVITLDTLTRSLGTLGLGPSGYAFVVSGEGKYLVHPREELVFGQETLFTTAWTSGDAALHTLAVRAIQGESGFVESQDAATGRVQWTFAQAIPSAGWSVFTVFYGDQFGPDNDWKREQSFLIIIFTLGGVCLLAYAASAYGIADTEVHHWATSAAVTFLLATAIATTWIVADRYPLSLPDKQEVVLDEGAAHQFLTDAGVDAARVMVPTGVLVRSIKIESGAEVAVSGYVWQRFEIGRQDAVPRGFMLPETFDPGQSEITEIFKERVDGQERIAWEFKATFRQRFDYSKFPFDRQSVWVRLRPASPLSTVVFVPDYSGYAMMNPAFRPGVDSSLVAPGWQVISSDFDYRLHSYNSTLGMAGRDTSTLYPELYFNVEMRRRFVGPFVTHIVPLAVTAAMLFALLLISSRREASEGLLGFSAAEVVLGAAALFFVASFQHTSLRDALSADTLIYFEYFYFGLYVLIMLVSINAILFASSLQLDVIEHRDNVIPKLAFWPFCGLAVFVLTVAQFY